jgi:hypothetical protein
MRILKFIGFLLLAAMILGIPAASNAQIAVGISVRIGPPALPVYVQPVCPGPGYIWTPGYWAHGDDDYYWVPGTWVMAPEPGFLWTPGYWGFSEGVYVWRGGYWGPHVGFYGGINYGFGYTGVGFWGGEWRGREFVYNRSVTNINTTINNVSYNGGPHGIQTRPSERERIAEHEHHIEARHEQIEHEHAARADRRQWASENHGRPEVAASGRPGDFHRDVVAARSDRGADHRADRPESAHGADRPEDRHADRPNNAAHDNRNAGRNDHPVNAMPASKTVSRNDRPSNAVNRDAAASRPNSGPSNNARPAKEMRPVPNNSRSNGPQGEARGNLHADRGPAQHSNAPHENAPHSNNKPEQGKPEHGKPEKP